MKLRTIDPVAESSQHSPLWMRHAVTGFEVDSRKARRGLRVAIALNVFGLGTLLANDLPESLGVEGRPSKSAANARR